MPNRRPKPIIAKLSQMTPNREPVICWTADALVESRVEIEPELFSGWSK